MPLPDFVVIGAAKCGTTSLHRYLGQHPEIFMASWGEPSFFAHEGATQPLAHGPGDDEWCFVTELTHYEHLFVEARAGQRRGEVSPRYLYFPEAPEVMRRHVPSARLVAILRQPVERAYSHFAMNRSRGCEPEGSFAAALLLERERAAAGWGWDWSYVSAGRYAQQLQRYYDTFPAAQIKVYLHEDLRDDPVSFFEDVFAFIGVDPGFRPDVSRRERVATMPRIHRIPQLARGLPAVASMTRTVVPASARRRLKGGVLALNSATPPGLPVADRRALTAEHFADDIAALEALIGRDLRGWR